MSSDKSAEQMLSELQMKRDLYQQRLAEVEQAINGLMLAVKHTRTTAGPSGRRSRTVKAVRNIVRGLEGAFTLKTVHPLAEQALGRVVPVAVVSQILARLHARGELELVEEGAGRKPATYRRAELPKLPDAPKVVG